MSRKKDESIINLLVLTELGLSVIIGVIFHSVKVWVVSLMILNIISTAILLMMKALQK